MLEYWANVLSKMIRLAPQWQENWGKVAKYILILWR